MISTPLEQIGKAFTEDEQKFITQNLKHLIPFFESDQGAEVLRLTLGEFREYLNSRNQRTLVLAEV